MQGWWAGDIRSCSSLRKHLRPRGFALLPPRLKIPSRLILVQGALSLSAPLSCRGFRLFSYFLSLQHSQVYYLTWTVTFPLQHSEERKQLSSGWRGHHCILLFNNSLIKFKYFLNQVLFILWFLRAFVWEGWEERFFFGLLLVHPVLLKVLHIFPTSKFSIHEYHLVNC